MAQSKNNKTLLIAAIVLLAAVLIMALNYSMFGPQPVEGAKAITIQVVDDQYNVTTYDIHTDAEFLRQAMEETEGLTFDGTESQYGMMVETVNGLTADWDKDQAWWSIYVNDELGNYGIDSQPVTDGDQFRLEYTTDDASR